MIWRQRTRKGTRKVYNGADGFLIRHPTKAGILAKVSVVKRGLFSRCPFPVMMPLSMQIRRTGNAILESPHVTSPSFLPEEVFATDASKLRFKESFFGRYANRTFRKWAFLTAHLHLLEKIFFSSLEKATFKVIRLVRVLGLRWIYQSFQGCIKYV